MRIKMILWSLDKPLTFNISHLRTDMWNSIIFFFGYLLRSLIIIAIKKSALKLSVTVAWNAELTNYYILSTSKKVSKFTRPTNMLNMTRIGLIISNIIKKKSVAQTRDFGILLSAIMLSISTAMRLRYLLHTKAVLIANLLGHQVHFIIRKRNRAYEKASYEQESIPKIGTTHFIITTEYGLEEPDDRLVTNNRKRINSSQVLEDQEMVEDGLIQT
jgi:hypothetical protein